MDGYKIVCEAVKDTPTRRIYLQAKNHKTSVENAWDSVFRSFTGVTRYIGDDVDRLIMGTMSKATDKDSDVVDKALAAASAVALSFIYMKLWKERRNKAVVEAKYIKKKVQALIKTVDAADKFIDNNIDKMDSAEKRKFLLIFGFKYQKKVRNWSWWIKNAFPPNEMKAFLKAKDSDIANYIMGSNIFAQDTVPYQTWMRNFVSNSDRNKMLWRYGYSQISAFNLIARG